MNTISKVKIIVLVFIIFSCIASFADEIDDFIADSRSEDRGVRANYAELLGNYKDERTFNRLIELVQDKDSFVRWRAADSLARLGDKRALPILKEVLVKTKGEEDLRHYIGEAIYKLGDKSLIPFWIERLEEQNPWLTELFVRAIVDYGYKGREASGILIKDLESRNEKLKVCAAYALAYIKEPRAYEGLLRLLVDSSFEVKQMAILALGHIENKDATPYLLLALSDEKDLIRIAAYHSLYRLGDPKAMFGVIDALNKEKDNHLRQYAVVTLGKLKDKNAVPVLLAILDEKETKDSIGKMALKADAIKALGEIGDEKAKERLEKFFKEMTSPGAPNFYSSGGGGGGRGDISPHITYLNKDFPSTDNVSNNSFVFQRFSIDHILNDPLYQDNVAVIIKKSLQKIDAAATKHLPQSEFTKAEYDAMIQSARAKLDSFKPSYFASLVDQLKNDKEAWRRSAAAKNLGISKDKNVVPYLIDALNDPNENVRAEVIESLGLIGDKATVLPLKGKLNDKVEFVRKRAAKALALIADSNNDIQLLEEILLKQNKEISHEAIFALGENARESSISLLIKCLHSEDKGIKKSALGAINRIGKKEIAPELHFLLEDKDQEIRIETIRILGYLRDGTAFDKLIQMYDEGDVETKSVIISSLKYIKDPRAISLLKKALKDPNERIKSQASYALKDFGRADLIVSLDEIKSDLESGDFKLEKNAIESLSNLESGSERFKAITILNSALKHKNVKVRRLAALSIKADDPEVISILIDMLKDKKLIDDYLIMYKAMNGEIRESELKLSAEDMEEASAVTQVIITLSIFGSPEAKEVFIELLKRDFDLHTKCLMIEGLGKMEDRGAIDVLKPYLINVETRKKAAIALGRLGDKSVLPLLNEYLNKGLQGLDNIELCEAFIGIGSPAVNDLVKALNSQDPEVKELAIHALGQIGDNSATPYLIKLIDENNPKITSDAVLALGAIGDRKALPVLINLYNSKKVNLQKEILMAFAGLPDKSIEPLLLEVAKNKNSALEFRCLSIETLGKIKDEKLVTFFKDLLQDENEMIRLTAAYALCKSGHSEYEANLKESLKNEALYFSAISMLFDLKGQDALGIVEATLRDKPEVQKKFIGLELKRLLDASKKKEQQK